MAKLVLSDPPDLGLRPSMFFLGDATLRSTTLTAWMPLRKRKMDVGSDPV